MLRLRTPLVAVIRVESTAASRLITMKSYLLSDAETRLTDRAVAPLRPAQDAIILDSDI